MAIEINKHTFYSQLILIVQYLIVIVMLNNGVTGNILAGISGFIAFVTTMTCFVVPAFELWDNKIYYHDLPLIVFKGVLPWYMMFTILDSDPQWMFFAIFSDVMCSAVFYAICVRNFCINYSCTCNYKLTCCKIEKDVDNEIDTNNETVNPANAAVAENDIIEV